MIFKLLSGILTLGNTTFSEKEVEIKLITKINFIQLFFI